tara:strand:- start:36125 stop:36769 length:645 start_codon:yes stop_codon:yes gene_type:complete
MATPVTNRTFVGVITVAVCAVSVLFHDAASASEAASETKPPVEKSSEKVEPRRQLFAGKVVLLQDALKRRGIKVAEEMKLQAVLETKSGELIPIAADWRGRAFFQDEKLRDRPVEIVGYRQPGIPYLQSLIVYFPNRKGEREEFDYWCDICAIPMYEIKDCECCQGPSRHRYRPAALPSYLFRSENFQPENESKKSSTAQPAAKDSPSEKKLAQ